MVIEISKARLLTPANGKHHFFGYFGIPPWSGDGKHYVCLESDFHDHMPRLGETAKIVLVNVHDGSSKAIADTRGWNFQQGAMLHWLPSEPSSKIVFNDCGKDGAYSRVLDVHTGREKRLPRPVNAVGKTRDIAGCVSFARLRKFRKVTSYPCANEYSKGGAHPDDDGLFIMDLDSGDVELVVTLDEIWKANPHTAALEDEDFEQLGIGLWFNHVAFNPGDTRVHFLARYPGIFKNLITSMWTLGVDGRDKHLLVDFGHRLSHFEWVTDDTLIVTMNWPEGKQKRHVWVQDKAGEESWKTIAPEVLTRDGHGHVNPDKTLMATDTYIVDGKRSVMVVELDTERVHQVHTFDNPGQFDGEIRCDPHPRWSRDGKQLSFDALGAHGRQVYVVDVTTS